MARTTNKKSEKASSKSTASLGFEAKLIAAKGPQSAFLILLV